MSWAEQIDAAVDERSRWHSANTGLVRAPALLGDHLIALLRDLASRDNADQSLLFCALDLRLELNDYEAETRALVKLADTGHVVWALERAFYTALELLGDPDVDEAREWHEQLRGEREEMTSMYAELLSDENRLLSEIGDTCQQLELQTRIKHNLHQYGRVLTPGEVDIMSAVFDAVTRLSGVLVVALPNEFATTVAEWPDAEKSVVTGEETCLEQAAVWSELRHPNVRRFYGACHVGVSPFVIHEMCEPVDCDGFDWRRIMGCARGVLYVHERGFVHQSLTAGHLLFSHQRQEGVLSGLGLVRRDDEDIVVPGEFGEPGHRQFGVADGRQPSAAGDVKALGLTIFTLLMRDRVEHTDRDRLESVQVTQLPNVKPIYLNVGEWQLLRHMCIDDSFGRMTMERVVHQMAELAKREVPLQFRQDFDMRIEVVDDINQFYLDIVNMTLEEALDEAAELCAEQSADGNANQLVLARLMDIHKQLIASSVPVSLLLVKSFGVILGNFLCRLEDVVDFEDSSQSFESIDSNDSSTDWNCGYHHDIDRLLQEHPDLDDNAAVHHWKPTWKEFRQRRKDAGRPIVDDSGVTLPDKNKESGTREKEAKVPTDPVPGQLGVHLLHELAEVEEVRETSRAIQYCRWNLQSQLAAYDEESRPLLRLAHLGRVVLVLERALTSAMCILNALNPPPHESWKQNLQKERNENVTFYNHLLDDEERFVREMGDERQQREVLAMLTCGMGRFSEVLTSEEHSVTAAVYDAVVRHSTVVVETLPAWFATSEDEWSMAQKSVVEGGEEACTRQADIWSELHHPNVRKFYGACHVGKAPFVIHDASSDLTSLDSSEFAGVWKLFLNLARGLQYVHGQGFAHQQLSTANLQISWERKGVLSGMGLVRLPGDDATASGESDGIQERQLNSSAEVSVASDILSFGLAIFNFLRRRPVDIIDSTESSARLATTNDRLTHLDVVELQLQGMNRRRARRVDLSQSKNKGVLPAERPSYVKEAEWRLLTRMCSPDISARKSMNVIICELERLAGEASSSTAASDATEFVREPVKDVGAYGVLDLGNQSIDDTLDEAKKLSNQLLEPPVDNQKVYARLKDVYEQLRTASSVAPLPASLVENFSRLLSRFVYQLEKETDIDRNAPSYASTHHSSADKNIPLHYDIDRLINENSAILVRRNQVHRWQRTSVQYKVQQQVRAKCRRPSPLPACPETCEMMVNQVERDQVEETIDDDVATEATIVSDAKWLLSPDEVKLGDPIGEGSYGAVCAGTWLGTDVVVKQVVTNQDKAVYREQFLWEAELWFGLNHMNLIRLYGAWVEGRPSFVCERAIYGTLKEYSEKKSREEIWRSLYIAAQGLQHLHERGIAHGDLKGDNILVCEYETVKLADFGLSVILNPMRTPKESDGSTMGAIRWKAPECLKGAPPSLASDIYSFGMCILEALTRQYPWGPNQADNVVAHQVEQGDLPNRPESFSITEWNLVERMCCFDPQDRISVGAVVNIAYGLYMGVSPQARQLFDQERSRTITAQVEHSNPAEADVRLQTKVRSRNPVLRLRSQSWYIPQQHVDRQESPFSHGSFGKIYRARYMGATVVVKQLRPFDDDVGKWRFLHEADLWFSLKHPNVIELYGACHEDQPFFVCEEAAKGTLNQFAEENYRDIWRLLRDAAFGVRYLHAKGVVHGDLKGINILIGEDGQAKIADFGLSFMSDNADSRILGIDGALGGIRWKAPEVLQGGRSTFESDVYSFGMCIIEIVSGKLPWGLLTDEVVGYNVAQSRLLPRRPEQFSDAQWDLVTRMCAFDPRERISMDAAVCILESFWLSV